MLELESKQFPHPNKIFLLFNKLKIEDRHPDFTV